MKPEEIKARELIEKFKSIEIGSEGFHSWGMEDWQAKQCALICCDRVIEFINNMPLQNATRALRKEQREFEESVREAITNLK